MHRKYVKKEYDLGRLLQPVAKAEGGEAADIYQLHGLASIFDAVDAMGDVMQKGAFKDAQFPVAMLLAHQSSRVPVGLWREAKETAKGLEVHGELIKGIKDADEAALAYAFGALRGLSVGGWVEGTPNKHGGIDIKKFELREISLTAFPACPDAELMAPGKTQPEPTKTQLPALDLTALENLQKLLS